MNIILLLVAILPFVTFGQTITMPAGAGSGSTTACAGTFVDHAGVGANYGNSQNSTFTICASTPGQALQLLFTEFATESSFDVLTIYDGNSTAATVIGTYSGTVSPGQITSTNPGGCLTFRFVSDGSVTNIGWSATISCFPPPLIMSNSSISTCSGTFLDPGGTGPYANSTTTTFTICPNTAGYRSSVSFSSFATEAGLDILTIYDGNSTAAPVLGTFSGATLPGTITASLTNPTGCLTFRFVTDGSVNLAGWVADISCVLSCQTITANLVSTNPVTVANVITSVRL